MVVDEPAAGSAVGNSVMRDTVRWMAPELMYSEEYDLHGMPDATSLKGDMYLRIRRDHLEVRIPHSLSSIGRFGASVEQVITGCRPFNDLNGGVAVMFKPLGGERPYRPPSGFTD